jgi:hypothetical protein
MTMAELKMTKGRRKKDASATDDVAQNMTSWPTRGAGDSMNASTTNGASTNGHSHHAVEANERRRMIAEAAYYRAMRRGFVGGSPEGDWLEAEAEIVALLANAGMRA